MTTTRKVARRKLSLLQLAQEINNVHRACEIMGYSLQQFYEIRRNYQTYGAEGLIDRLPGAPGPHPNRVSPEVEQAILAHCPEYPRRGVQVSSGGVRGRLGTASSPSKHERLLRLEEHTREQRIELNEKQIRLWSGSVPSFGIATSRPRTRGNCSGGHFPIAGRKT